MSVDHVGLSQFLEADAAEPRSCSAHAAEPSDFSVAFDAFYAALEDSKYTRASQIAQTLPCARPLSMALQQLVSCELLYLSMHHFARRHSPLEGRLDKTARDLEACLSSPALLPGHSHSLRNNWLPLRSREAVNDVGSTGSTGARHARLHLPPSCFELSSMYLESLAIAVVTCRAPAWPVPSTGVSDLFSSGAVQLRSPASSKPSFPPSPSPAAIRGGCRAIGRLSGVSEPSPFASTDALPSLADCSLSAAQRGALSDSVELLRLRRAMLPIYAELLSGSGSLGTQAQRAVGLADRVRELRSSRAAALGAPLLASTRELTIIEMGALEPLLRSHALLPDAQLRDSLLQLALARQELHKLGSTSTSKDQERSVASNLPMPFVGSFPFMRSPGGAATPQPSDDEPNLHYFLRTFASRLADKAAFLLHSTLAAHPQMLTLPPPPGGPNGMLLRSSAPPPPTPSGLGLGLSGLSGLSGLGVGRGRPFAVGALSSIQTAALHADMTNESASAISSLGGVGGMLSAGSVASSAADCAAGTLATGPGLAEVNGMVSASSSFVCGAGTACAATSSGGGSVGGAGIHTSAVGYTYGASLSTAITAGLDVDCAGRQRAQPCGWLAGWT